MTARDAEALTAGNDHGAPTLQQAGVSGGVRRTLSLVVSTSAGFLVALFQLTKGNLFNPVPWMHDDYNNVVARLPSVIGIRPVSTFALHFFALAGPAAVFAMLIVLVIVLQTLAFRFACRWLSLELSPICENVVAFLAALALGLSEAMPYIVRYTGNFTHLLSAALAFGAVLFGMSFIEGSERARWAALILYTLAVFAKEDVPAFATTALFLWAAFRFARSRDRVTLRRGAFIVFAVIAISLCAIRYNIIQEGSFVNTTLRGAAGYGFSGSMRETLDNFWSYLSSGRLLLAMVALHLLAVVVLAFPLRTQWLRFCCFSVLITTLIFPYAILSKTHIFEYYTIIWLPLLVASTALGLERIAMSFRVPAWGQLLMAVALLVLINQQTRVRRDSISLWIGGHQWQNRRILFALERLKPQLSRARQVCIRGIDGGYSPFFFTDGNYASQLVKNPGLTWIVLVRPDSFMAEAYSKSGMPRQQPHVLVEDDSNETASRPLISFDDQYRATMLR